MVRNIHIRDFAASPERVGALVDTLASDDDRVWPSPEWPPMRFDRPLQVGAEGGHGPIRYRVSEYTPGRVLHCEFLGPRGFNGWHRLEVQARDDGGSRLVHTLQMHLRWPAVVTWPFAIRWFHDTVMEDAYDRTAIALGETPRRKPWSPWVRLLYRLLKRGRSTVANRAPQPAPRG